MTIESAAATIIKDTASVGVGVAKVGVGLYTKILTYLFIGLSLIAIGAGPTWYYTRKYEVDYYTSQIEKANTEAQKQITTLTEAKAQVDLELAGAKNDIQNKYTKEAASDAATIADLKSRNARLWINVTNKNSSAAAAQHPGSTGSDPTAGTGAILLPQPTSDDLLRLASTADGVSAELRACQSWVATTQQELKVWQAKVQEINKKQK
jgi:hypothetical protein